MRALSLHVTGIVQGVGFRPFVHSLATEQGLSGWVLNASDGLHCWVEGDDAAVERFPALLAGRAPAMSVIEELISEEAVPAGLSGFEILESRSDGESMTLVSPDIATCPACLSELTDPGDRRHGYAFTNCTNCGPRFTIIDDVPYDRPMTTMRDFPMCPECAEEYDNPHDRRFHAQPNACFRCGPRLYLNPGHPRRPAASPALGQSSPGDRDADALRASTPSPAAELAADLQPDGIGIDPTSKPDWLWSPNSEPVPRPRRDHDVEAARSAAILDSATALLLDGRILAIKGLGGFHLACDATSESAVASLRERKRRWGKPLAIMCPDLTSVRTYCKVSGVEESLLTGAVRPIVLLRRHDGASDGGCARSSTGAVGEEDCLSTESPSDAAPLAASLAPGLTEIGVMLPYTPLHHLLLARVGRPLVMTSGNLSDEPIATDNAEALERLAPIADAFLMHDREIHSRYDDSVMRVVDGIIEPVRRSRGYAPHPLPLPFEADTPILAAGPEQKNTFTLLTGKHAFVSQHIGDLENAETLASYEETISLYRRLFRVRPAVIAHDLHPEYLSTKWALEQRMPLAGVQHHHAHIASVTGEHGVSGRVIGIAFDGTGYGEDGNIWGGEVLLADWEECERVAHLRYVPMPGAAAAVKRPARMAIGTLHALELLDHPGAKPLRSRLAEGEERTLVTMAERGVNSPLTSSMGRLFDAVSAIAGVADDARYEGEAAILLEACADPAADGAYAFAITDPHATDRELLGAPLVIDPTPVLAAILDDVAAGASPGAISMRFHRAVTALIVGAAARISERTGVTQVALSGGCFMNRILLDGAISGLRSAGMEPLTHRVLPMNDGAVSFGQAVVAWARGQRPV